MVRMSNVIVSSGVTSSGLAVSRHGTPTVLRGGAVVDTSVLQAGGTELVGSGGSVTQTYVDPDTICRRRNVPLCGDGPSIIDQFTVVSERSGLGRGTQVC
jgi:autotransporter passenger strand-loop-strand repeat protein